MRGDSPGSEGGAAAAGLKGPLRAGLLALGLPREAERWDLPRPVPGLRPRPEPGGSGAGRGGAGRGRDAEPLELCLDGGGKDPPDCAAQAGRFSHPRDLRATGPSRIHRAWASKRKLLPNPAVFTHSLKNKAPRA